VTIGDALDRYLVRYRLSGRRGLSEVERRVRKHVAPFFGGRQVGAVDEDDLVSYWGARNEGGAGNATVRAELAALRRALKLARVRVPAMPEDLSLPPARVGFLEMPDFDRACSRLPEALQGSFTFAYVTGWRMRDEVFPLLKTDVDLTGGWVTLRDSKNRESRRFPLDCLGLRALVLHQLERPPVSARYLFHRFNGKPIRNAYGAWRLACRAAGLETILPHDFRRSAVRNLVNAGVDHKTAMLLTGHKTDHVFWRYRIVNERDLRAATAKLGQLLGR
jgi:integrase